MKLDALHAEMWELYLGIDKAWRVHFDHLIVKSDFKILFEMVSRNFKFYRNISIYCSRWLLAISSFIEIFLF